MNKSLAIAPIASTTPIPVEYLPPARNIDERAARVGSYYHSGKRAAAQLVVYNLLAGIELIGIRDELAHGHWLKWCEKNLPEGMSYRSAAYFIGLAEALIPKIANAANFDFKQLQLTNGDLDEKQIQTFSGVVREVTNGKAYIDLLREYGLMAPLTHQKDRDNSRKLTPAESAAARKEAAQAFADLLIGNDLTFCADNESTHQLHADLDAAKIKEILDAGLTRNRLCKDILKARKSKKVGTVPARQGPPRGPLGKKKGSKK